MPIQRFAERPDNAAIAKLLARNEWLWHNERYNDGERWVDGFQVRAGNVLDGVWHQTLGRRPTRLFPPKVEFPDM